MRIRSITRPLFVVRTVEVPLPGGKELRSLVDSRSIRSTASEPLIRKRQTVERSTKATSPVRVRYWSRTEEGFCLKFRPIAFGLMCDIARSSRTKQAGGVEGPFGGGHLQRYLHSRTSWTLSLWEEGGFKHRRFFDARADRFGYPVCGNWRRCTNGILGHGDPLWVIRSNLKDAGSSGRSLVPSHGLPQSPMPR